MFHDNAHAHQKELKFLLQRDEKYQCQSGPTVLFFKFRKVPHPLVTARSSSSSSRTPLFSKLIYVMKKFSRDTQNFSLFSLSEKLIAFFLKKKKKNISIKMAQKRDFKSFFIPIQYKVRTILCVGKREFSNLNCCRGLFFYAQRC